MIRALAALMSTVVLAAVLAVSPAAPAGADTPPKKLGPGDAKVHDVGGTAIIRWSKWGYVYISGKQHNRLRIRYIEKLDAIRFRDKGGTHSVRSMPGKKCDKKKMKRGIQVTCKIPPKFENRRMFVQVWPRLGNDVVDARDLPAKFRLWALMDAGNDVVWGGHGDDFVNAAFDNDVVHLGKGDDWVRGGPGHDRLYGGPGKDRVVQ